MRPHPTSARDALPVERGAARRRPSPRLAVAVLAACLALAPALLTGCATRTVRHTIQNDNLIIVDLVREQRLFSTIERDFEHPAILSVPRLTNILNAVEIEMRTEDGVIRQPAFHASLVPRISEALSAALEQADPNEAVGVKAIRKDRRLGILHRKYLTTFLAHVKDGQLYLAIRRVDWPLPTGAEHTKTKNVLPEPIRERAAMDFRVVTGEPIYFAGPQDLEIDWKSDVFRTTFRLPGSTKGRKRKREVLESSRIPNEEFAPSPGEAASVEDLTPEQLRALADLAEDRREGRITETTYQRERRQLLRKR